MGDPQHAMPVIHVTGTNGKGSTVQMITRLLMAQRADRRHLHEPAPRAHQRAPQAQRRADQRRGLRRADRRRSPTSRLITGVRPTYFESGHRRRVPLVRRRRRRRGGGRGRDARPVGRDQRRRRPGGGRSPTSASTTPSSPARRWPTSPARRPGIIKPGSAVVVGETEPELVDIFRGRGAAPAISCAASDFDTDRQRARRRRPLGRPAHADDDLPRRVRAAARRPPGRQRRGRARPRSRRSSPPRWPSESCIEGFANVEMPGRFEVIGRAAARRSSTAPTTRRRRRVRARCSSTTSSPTGGGSS